METRQPSNPSIFVIFGAGGDLTWRKLVPALYDLFLDHWLPEKFQVIGVGLDGMSDTKFRNHLRSGVDQFSRRGKTEKKVWDDFAGHLNFTHADLNEALAYKQLSDRLDDQDKAWDVRANRIFYLALPPGMIEPVARRLNEAKLNLDRERARIVVEKPFGKDLESARNLNRMLSDLFQERQIFRIDLQLRANLSANSVQVCREV